MESLWNSLSLNRHIFKLGLVLKFNHVSDEIFNFPLEFLILNFKTQGTTNAVSTRNGRLRLLSADKRLLQRRSLLRRFGMRALLHRPSDLDLFIFIKSVETTQMMS